MALGWSPRDPGAQPGAGGWRAAPFTGLGSGSRQVLVMKVGPCPAAGGSGRAASFPSPAAKNASASLEGRMTSPREMKTKIPGPDARSGGHFCNTREAGGPPSPGSAGLVRRSVGNWNSLGRQTPPGTRGRWREAWHGFPRWRGHVPHGEAAQTPASPSRLPRGHLFALGTPSPGQTPLLPLPEARGLQAGRPWVQTGSPPPRGPSR